jgi:hypothetical protein
MPYYSIPLKAGIPYRHDVDGSLVLIDSVGVSGGVDITLIRNGTPSVTMPLRQKAFRYVAQFEGVILKTSVDATVGLFLSNSDVQLGVSDGLPIQIPGGVVVTNPVENPVRVLFPANATMSVPNGVAVNGPVIIGNLPGNPIPITFPGGVVNMTATNVLVSNQPLANIVHQAPVSVGLVATALVSDATLKKLRIRNGHATAVVALGGAGVTLANAAIQLLPGDVWLEDDAAGAAWYAISDTAGINVQVQGLK